MCRARLAREGSPEQDIVDMFPASPFVRQQRSRRRRPDIDSMPRYMHYDASEHLKSPMQSVVALHALLHTRLPHKALLRPLGGPPF